MSKRQLSFYDLHRQWCFKSAWRPQYDAHVAETTQNRGHGAAPREGHLGRPRPSGRLGVLAVSRAAERVLLWLFAAALVVFERWVS